MSEALAPPVAGGGSGGGGSGGGSAGGGGSNSGSGNAQTILSTIMQHLPTVHSSPELADAIFAVIYKAHRTQDPLLFTIPLLPSLAAITLTAPSTNLLLSSAHLVVTLVSSLAHRRAHAHSTAFVSDILSLVQQLLQSRSVRPVSFALPTFSKLSNSLKSAVSAPVAANVRQTHNYTLPLIPQTLNAALLLLALHIPSTQSLPSFLSSSSSSPLPSSSSSSVSTSSSSTSSFLHQVKLWRSLGPRLRTSIITLASRYELLTARCGAHAALLCAHMLHRALDPANTVPLSSPLRARVARAASDALPHAVDTSTLLRLVGTARVRRTLPASALPYALGSDAAATDVVRAFSRAGRLDFASRASIPLGVGSSTATESEDGSGNRLGMGMGAITRPRKRHRPNPKQQNVVDEDDDDKENEEEEEEEEEEEQKEDDVEDGGGSIQRSKGHSRLSEALQTISLSDSRRLSPASVLLRSHISMHHTLTHTNMTTLTHALEFCADALNFSLSSGFSDWRRVAMSLVSSARGSIMRFSTSPQSRLWPSVLALCCVSWRLRNVLHQHKDCVQLVNDCLCIILPLVCQHVQNVPVEGLSTLLEELGDARNVFGRSFDKVIESIGILADHALSTTPLSSPLLLRAVFHAKLAVSRPIPTPDAPTRLAALVNDTTFSSAALHALADELCASLSCTCMHIPPHTHPQIRNIAYHEHKWSGTWDWNFEHTSNDDSSTRLLADTDAQQWAGALEAVVQSVSKKSDVTSTSDAIVHAITAMVAHCPSTATDPLCSALIDIFWSARDTRTIVAVLSGISSMLGQTRVTGNVSAMLMARLRERARQVPSVCDHDTNDSSHRGGNDKSLSNFRAIAYHLLLNFDDTHATQASALACHSLLQLCGAEILASTTSISSKSVTSNDSNNTGVHAMRIWADAFVVAMLLHERVDRQGAPVQALGSMLFSRVSDWAHLALPRMLRDDDFAAFVAMLNLEQSASTLRMKLPRHVVTPLLLRNDVRPLSALADRLSVSLRHMVDKSVADALAVMAMTRAATDNEHNDDYSVITGVLGKPIVDIVRAKAGKIVQRLVMEFGGPREQSARMALTKFAQMAGDSRRKDECTMVESQCGLLVANHFLLVMDAVNRRLFQSRATEREQVRHLRMLKVILLTVKSHIHAFVPKILATLKLALDSFCDRPRVYSQTFEVWSCFLDTLGPERIVVHLTSILTIMSPFLPQLDTTLCNTLASLIQNSTALHTYPDRSLVVLLLRMSNHHLLVHTADVVDETVKSNGNGIEAATTALASSSSVQHEASATLIMDVPAMERVCLDVGKIIAQHGNGIIEVMAAQYLLSILRTNRDQVDAAARSCSTGSSAVCVTSSDGLRLAHLLTHLVEQLSMTRNDDCRRITMQCIGEVGAIDPAIVSQASSRRHMSRTQQEYPTNIYALVALLLDDFLVPTLLAQGEMHSASTTSRINRIGLVVQELIRVCGCKRDTAVRAAKSSRTRGPDDATEAVQWHEVLVGKTHEENAIYFWENLRPATRDVIEPYLAEPFDVQHYKGVFGGNVTGNEEVACQPVWSKIKASVSAGVVPNAQEWRRQTAVQLVDFIGKQGAFGEVLLALRPILRYEDPVTAFIFPLVITNALDSQAEKKSTRLRDFLIIEVGEVLEEAAAPKIMFDLFDILRDWRESRCFRRAVSRATRQFSSNTSTSQSKRRAVTPKYTELEKTIDPLSCFVDLYENLSGSISLLAQARCAFRARSYARAIMLSEHHLRLKRQASDELRSWPSTLDVVLGKLSTKTPVDADDVEVMTILQRSFAELDNADSMRGLATLRSTSTLAEQVIDTEVSGQFNEALITYERAIAQSPRSVQFHRGFLRCLMTLGHWETMLSHAEGLSHSAKLQEKELRKTAEANGIEAAWRLGRWDNIRSYDSVPFEEITEVTPADVEPANSWDNDFSISFGNVLLSLRDRNAEALHIAADSARENLLIPIIRAALEGYNRAYPMIARLHAIADVEDTMEELMCKGGEEDGEVDTNGDMNGDILNESGYVNGSGRKTIMKRPRIPLVSMPGRTSTTAPSLKVREPLLSTKRVCFEQLCLFNDSARVSLELSDIAKHGDNLRSAAATTFRALHTDVNDEGVKHALVMETAEIQRKQGDSSGALLIVKEEINRLSKLLHHDSNQAPGSVSAMRVKNTRDRLCSAYVVAGSWIAESRSAPSEVVLEYFQKAKAFGPSREEPFYALGKHYDSLLQASLNADEDLTVNSDINNSQGRSSGRRSTMASLETHAPEHSSKYVPQVIKFYARTLCNGHSHVFEALPRMLTVWFDYYTALDDGKEGWRGMDICNQVHDVVHLAFYGVPLYMWMTALPQLMSRILHRRKDVREELSLILARVICHFPDQAYWTVIPTTQLKNSPDRKKAMSDILNRSISMVRKDKRGEFDPTKKASFRTRIFNWLVIQTAFISICEAPGSKDKRGRQDNCKSEFRDLKIHLRSTEVINPMMPTLKSLTVRLPTIDSSAATSVDDYEKHQHLPTLPTEPIHNRASHRPFDREVIRIHAIEDQVLVMSSLMCPRRISLLGTDGRQYRYLAKKEDKGDMRRDSRVVEFLTIMNQLLSKEEETCNKSLQLRTYAVLPLTEETGMIEWVNDLCPFRTLVTQEHGRLDKIPGQIQIKQRYEECRDKRDFLTWACTSIPPIMDRFFVRQFGGGADAHAWLAARDEWTQSAACWSISGHIVGLGDRHGENVLVETRTGKCVHVDFAMLFEKGRRLKVPEVVPFRLTQNMVCAMGVAGYEGLFRTVCEIVMRAVRRNGDALLSRLESFLYDPLADWARNETHGAKAGVMATREAWHARATVKAKLTGMVDKSGLALSIEGQVERLIREASSIENLSKMYIWWGAWI